MPTMVNTETDLFNINISLINKRWPHIGETILTTACKHSVNEIDHKNNLAITVDGFRLNSFHDPRREATLQSSHITETDTEVWCYGVTNGLLANQILLNKNIHSLHITPIGLALFKLCLKYFDHSQWLQDPRVSLNIPANTDQVQQPCCIIPACFHFADEQSSSLASKLEDYLNATHSDIIHKRDTSLFEFQIATNQDRLRHDGDVRELYQQYNEQTAYVVSGGPSAFNAIPMLKQLKESALIIAVDAALTHLIQNQITPTIAITIDANYAGIGKYFSHTDELSKNIPLVYFPVSPHQLLEKWQGPRYAAYGYSSIYHKSSSMTPKGVLISNGTVAIAALDLAAKLGVQQIILIGYDYCFPDNKLHLNNDAALGVIHQQKEVSSSFVFNGYGEKTPSLPNLKTYLLDTEWLISKYHLIEFINFSRLGAKISGTRYFDELNND